MSFCPRAEGEHGDMNAPNAATPAAQPTQSELERQESQRQAERRAARLGTPKGRDGAATSISSYLAGKAGLNTNGRCPITKEHLAALQEYGLWTEELAKQVWLATQRDTPQVREQAKKFTKDDVLAWARGRAAGSGPAETEPAPQAHAMQRAKVRASATAGPSLVAPKPDGDVAVSMVAYGEMVDTGNVAATAAQAKAESVNPEAQHAEQSN